MAEISHQKLPSFLKDEGALQSIPIFIFHGEEYLYKKAMQQVLNLLLPGGRRNHNCIAMDGGHGVVAKAIAEVNTFSFLEDGKVVIVNDAGIFGGEQSNDLLVSKIQNALSEEKPDKAARDFLSFLSHSGFTLDDLNIESKTNTSASILAAFTDQNAIKELIRYCREKKIKPAENSDQGDFLQASIEKGFPADHHLMVSEDNIDRRRKLFKVIKEHGLVVDCSVPKGARKADKDVQNAVLGDTSKTILSSHGKTMEPAAYQKLCEMTGFDLPVFSQNLEKLVNYVGDRVQIKAADVTAVVERSRQDPIFEFTNAILNRNAKEALFLLDSLLHQEIYPLQVLTAMIKQIRNLLIAKDFALSSKGKVWRRGCSYGLFTSKVMPAIEEYDREMTGLLDNWRAELDAVKTDAGPDVKKKSKKRSSSVSSDLRLAKNPRSPYPVYQLMLRTESFSREKILASLEKLSQADYQLKTTPRPPKLVLEDAILFICNLSKIK